MRGPNASRSTGIICKRSFTIVLLIFAAMAVSPPAGAHAPGLALYGVGSARIDGVMSPREWDGAGCIDFPVNVPEGGTVPGTVCVMNDTVNLHLAVRFARGVIDPGNTASFEFDNDHSGGPKGNGDDILLLNPDIGFFDEVRTTAPPCPGGALCGLRDTEVGGSNDGAGAFHNDGMHTVYEFSHPLNSGDDARDFSVGPGSTIGFSLFIRMIDAAGRLADTDFPAFCNSCPNLLGDIVVLPAPASPTAPTPLPPVPAAPLSATVTLNGSVFHPDQTITYQAILDPGDALTLVDIYLGTVLPDGVTFLSLVRGSDGVISIALGPAPILFQANVPLTRSIVTFSHTFEGFEAAGTYSTYARLAIAGRNPLLPENQLSVAEQSFQFSPDVCLSVSVNSGGSVAISPPGRPDGPNCYRAFAPGTTVTLTAQAQGSTFNGWTGDCALAGTHATCTLVMTTNKHVGASFSTAGTGGCSGYAYLFFPPCGFKLKFQPPRICLFC
jgi:hypothetical protein